ncbi:hypothetical protein THAOC_05093 [Thalassiosira oceanica]|uniref:VOC domain-containing protein n=1 Tax=Thalassiosira oceanica TaxID=159749 RepID=K0T6K8_THAOC|nr:hypothetical protein THAOC_05093 [Thalassiosira oceanica]|eukprot:EJK73290.1 hypothetical protein THAOC_05093 [Thalassiosira oceanica]
MKSKLLSLTTVALAVASASAGGLRRSLNTGDRTSPAASEGAEPAAPKSEKMSDSKAHKVSSSILGNGKSGKKSKGISSAKATKTGVTDDASASGEAVMAKSAKETSAGAKSAKTEIAKDTKIRSDGALGMAAISHINAVVDDSVEEGAKYYEMLGFYPAENADGPMNYPNITNYGFCVDAGFDACRVDIIFLKHEVINLYLELFFYYEPKGDTVIPIKQTNDAGGIRHIAVEVEDAVATYNELKSKDHQGRFITKDTPIPLDPFPYTFFYWVDKYGIQWEFEQGRPVEYYHIAGITG